MCSKLNEQKWLDCLDYLFRHGFSLIFDGQSRIECKFHNSHVSCCSSKHICVTEQNGTGASVTYACNGHVSARTGRNLIKIHRFLNKRIYCDRQYTFLVEQQIRIQGFVWCTVSIKLVRVLTIFKGRRMYICIQLLSFLLCSP